MKQSDEYSVEQRMQAVAGQLMAGKSEDEREEYVLSMADEFETILNNLCRHNQIKLSFSISCISPAPTPRHSEDDEES